MATTPKQPVIAPGGIEVCSVQWKAPKVSADATRIKSLDGLHRVLQVIHDPQSLSHLRDSFRRMSGYHKGSHPLYDEREGFRDVYDIIRARGNDLGFTFSADRFHEKRT